MKIGWRGALGLVLSAAFLVWTMREVSFGEVWTVLRHSSVPVFILSAVVATLIFPLRALRWRVILEPVAHDISLGALWRSTAIGMMVNNVVPARAGELARAYALTREDSRVSFAAAFASLAVDRIFDAVTVVILLVAAMFLSDFPAGTTISGQPVIRIAILAGVIAVGALGAVVAMALYPRLVLAVFDGVVGRIAPRFVERGRRLIESFMSGLGALRSPSRFFRVLGWAMALWLVNGFAFWLGFVAVGIEAPYFAALFLMGVIAIGVALPSSPGFFGLFEAAALAGLTLYGVPGDLAVSWALGFHLLSFLPITLIGLYYFGRLGMTFGELGQATSPSSASEATA
ncbi:MAG: flippase-like domain-containing protein [Gemmatimonadaceae bacterium]|nr:flippase-like domain-containing protein [Gemmatimonadaceae bacterium]